MPEHLSLTETVIENVDSSFLQQCGQTQQRKMDRHPTCRQWRLIRDVINSSHLHHKMQKTNVQKSMQAEGGHGRRKIKGSISSCYSEEMHEMEIISHKTSRHPTCRRWRLIRDVINSSRRQHKMQKTNVQKSMHAEDGHGRRKIKGRTSSRYSEEMHHMEIISRKEKRTGIVHAGGVDYKNRQQAGYATNSDVQRSNV